MSIDLIVYGVVAAGLIVWLRSILGTRHGGERSPPPLTISETGQVIDLNEKRLAAQQPDTQAQSEKIKALVENPTETLSINKEAEENLIRIAETDRQFEVNDFLNKVQDAFAIVVESFAATDRATLRELLSETVYASFDQAMADRENAGERMVTDIHAIRKTEILEAGLENKQASITIRFVAEETSITRNESDEIIAGHPDKVVEMQDIWVFGRDLKSDDLRWWVLETRGDFEQDNTLLPNTT